MQDIELALQCLETEQEKAATESELAQVRQQLFFPPGEPELSELLAREAALVGVLDRLSKEQAGLSAAMAAPPPIEEAVAELARSAEPTQLPAL